MVPTANKYCGNIPKLPHFVMESVFNIQHRYIMGKVSGSDLESVIPVVPLVTTSIVVVRVPVPKIIIKLAFAI